MTTSNEPYPVRDCTTCKHTALGYNEGPCDTCAVGSEGDSAAFTNWTDPDGPDTPSTNSLPEDADSRNEYPMADGLLDYFPNALAEVSRLSYRATQQHHPDKPMHWDRSKSLDHRNKIIRHLIDSDGVDDKGIDHWAMVCWRALAGYQEYLEKKHNLRPSRASKNVPA